MPERTIDVDGTTWRVTPSGHVTQYTRDEFTMVFISGTGPDRVERVAKYSPIGARSRELSLNELTEKQLRELFARSQPSWTSPDTGYRR
ncbi:MAG: hypothetical protein R2910_11790 [Gemmatimonadales bacterium]